MITEAGGGVWQTPYTGWWIVALRQQADPSIVDLFFDFWQSASSYTVALTFANGSSQTIQTSLPVASAIALTGGSAMVTALSSSVSSMANQSALDVNSITKIGIFRPQTGEWFLDRNGNSQWDGCAVDICISSFGQAGDWPAIGNWSGGATSNIGTFNSITGVWQIDRNGNGRWDGCAVDICIRSFGQPGDLPVTRKISGVNGTIVGVFQPGQSLWHFDKNSNTAFDGCAIDECTQDFGGMDDRPVVGDWNGMGTVDRSVSPKHRSVVLGRQQ